MSFLISYTSLGMSYGSQNLFSDLSMAFSEGEKIGLIGPNGSGKSTLLKIFAGEIQPDHGNRIEKKYVKAVYLPQQDMLDPEKTIDELCMETLENTAGKDTEMYSRGQRVIGQALFKDMSKKAGELSGGMRKRLSVTLSLIKQPDILFLDEPTNHLDLEGILWLEQILQNATFSFVLVSHDRYLLNNATNRTIELNKVYPEGFLKFDGNYMAFLDKRTAFIEQQIRQETILANKMRRETEWLRQGAKARTTKAQYRIDNAAKLNGELEELKRRNREMGRVGIDFQSTGRKTKRLLEAFTLSKSIDGKKLFEDLSLALSPGIFIGLIGENGSGKSTLLKILAGMVNPDSGHVKTLDDIRIVMFGQDREQLNPDLTLKRALSPDSDSVIYRDNPVHVVTWAKKFRFNPEQLETPVGRLSGGEQARVVIANLMKTPADILLLDEPTNDLDIPTLEILEESLEEFPGAIVTASHDRYLLDSLATHILGFDGEGSVSLYAGVEQWVQDMQEKKKAKIKKKPKEEVLKETKPVIKKKFSFKHEYELEMIEDKILKAEEAVKKFEYELNLPETAKEPVKLQEICKYLAEAQKEVEQLYERWEELEALKS